jgi:flavin reductase (DIM6/NTAB) family NADH-FMN oxidoreductase RutF
LDAAGVTAGFNQLVAALDYPVFVVTTCSREGERSGCLIGFATQCSIHPPRFLACLSVKNHTFRVAQRAEYLVVHVLEDDDKQTAELFGGTTGDEVDKFAVVSWRPGPGGVPVLDGVKAWFAGHSLGVFDLGDHHGFLLEPVEADVADADPDDLLTFQDARDIRPGHEP